jgi:hypothetical protein
MNIDFFRVEDLAGGRIGFRNALREAVRARGRNRSCIVWDEPVGLFEGHEDGNLIEGEVGRIRMTDTPAIGSRECVLEEIELDDDQGIAERTAFLYDSGRGVLALHVRREAVSASRLCGYCDVFARNTTETFTLLPILRDDVQEQFRSMNVIKKVDVKFSRAAQTTLVDADQSTRSFVRALNNLNGSTISVTVASGAGAEKRLSFEGASDLIRNAFRQRNGSVERLVVSGRNAGDQGLVLDLLEARLRDKRTIEFRGRSASYEQRRATVRRAYESNLPLFG